MSEGIAFAVESLYDSADLPIDQTAVAILKLYELSGIEQDSETHEELSPRTTYFIPVSGNRQYKLSYGGGDKKVYTFSVIEGRSVLESIKYGFGEKATDKDAYHMPMPYEKQHFGEDILSHLNASLRYVIDGMENGLIGAI